MKSTNFKHIDTVCPECKCPEILQDPEHEITYCTHCGLVLQENTIFKITQVEQKIDYNVKFIRDLWKKNRL